ncbi:hypothetical protein AB691_3899 [Stutzerimonas stutzeri]|nr:hypothetical protein AB691_3899 [Stutzerimonas stutzeri]
MRSEQDCGFLYAVLVPRTTELANYQATITEAVAPDASSLGAPRHRAGKFVYKIDANFRSEIHCRSTLRMHRGYARQKT